MGHGPTQNVVQSPWTVYYDVKSIYEMLDARVMRTHACSSVTGAFTYIETESINVRRNGAAAVSTLHRSHHLLAVEKKNTSNTTRRLNGKTYVNCKGSISVPIIFLLKHKHKYPIQSSEKLNSHATCMFFTSYILLFVHIFIFHFFFLYIWQARSNVVQ